MTDATTGARAARLGFVGLGNIGAPMALRLAEWAGGLTVYDVSDAAVRRLADRGAEAAGSVGDLARVADIVGICVRDDEQARTVVGELLTTAVPGTVIAVHSTISPDTAADLAAHSADCGVALLDAPISGGAPGAEQARLAIMVGGDRESYLSLREPYSLVADMIVHAGAQVGMGTRMKLARNLLHFISFAATAEASRLAQACGVDLVKLGKVVRHTDAVTGGPGAIMLRDTTAPIPPGDGWYEVFTHVRSLGEKDLDLALATARDYRVDLPLGEVARRDLAAGLGVPHTEGDAP